jgi:uncharacterized membrane protein required for colicin V production
MRKKIAGIPIVSVLGTLCAISFAYMGYILYTNPLVGMVVGSPNTSGVEIAIGIIIACFIVYYASYAYHKAHGLDIGMAFKELPPV